MTLVKNRLHALRAIVNHGTGSGTGGGTGTGKEEEEEEAGGGVEIDVTPPSRDGAGTAAGAVVLAKCWAPPRASSTNWPFYSDNSVFGEKYAKMVDVDEASEESTTRWADLVPTYDPDAEVLESSKSLTTITDVSMVPPPPGGWLVLVCFHVLWSKACMKVQCTVRCVPVLAATNRPAVGLVRVACVSWCAVS
jgi:hypothetical protein